MSVQDPADYFRFCPGEEHVRLSDAVCRGRRRSSFHKCKGCQFNDDEKAAARVGEIVETPAPAAAGGREARPPAITAAPCRADIEELFRDTDIRGRCPLPLTPEAAWRIGHATGQFLRSKLRGYDRADPRSRSLVTACDHRPCSAVVHAALVSGIRASGTTVYDIGVVDTPQLYFAVRHLATGGGVITTGGRSPPDFSGFKVCGAQGRDVAVETGLMDIRDIAGRVPMHQTGTTAPRYEVDLSAPYAAWLRQSLVPAPARPLKVVVDAGGGVAGRWAPLLFADLPGLTVHTIRSDPAAPDDCVCDPINPRALTELRRAVRIEKADLGVCFDGDADTCVFVDERGALIRTDYAFAVLARRCVERSGGGIVVCDHRMGRAVEEELVRAGASVRRERPGSAFIKKAMTESGALVGGSFTGQCFFKENGCCESAMLAVAVMLSVVGNSQMPLSDFIRPLARYRMARERPIHSSAPEATLDRLAQAFGTAAEPLPDGLAIRKDSWWCHVARPTRNRGLSVCLEAATADDLRAGWAALGNVLKPAAQANVSKPAAPVKRTAE